jgi:hypothetical protein
MRSRWTAGVATGVALIAGLASEHGPVASSQDAFVTTPVTIDTPAAPNSAEPQLTSSPEGVLLSWIERDGPRATFKFAERTAGGWSAARVVASGDNWFVNWADVPSVMRLSSGALVAHWLQKNGGGVESYDVRLAYSGDRGRTWSPSFLPHSDGTKTEHGFASLFETSAGGFGLVWLDGRAMQSPGAGAMTLQSATFDRGWKQTSEVAVEARVCECCPTAAAVTADGPIVAFRDRSGDEIRDIAVSRLEGGRWSDPQPVANDRWNITGCPVNGPMLAASGRTVAIAWFTGADKQNRSFVAFSQDAGRTFGKPIRIDDAGSLGRVDVELLDDRSAVATWIEYGGSGAASFRARRVEASGRASLPVTIAPMTSDRSAGYPRLARHGSELVFAWTESTAPAPGQERRLQVRTASARLLSERR